MKFEVEINTNEKGFVAEFNSVQTVEPIVEPLEVTENGTYTVPEGVVGYTPVTVNVVPTGEITITENGVHDVSDYASAVVDVELVSDVDALIDGSITEIRNDNVTAVKDYAFHGCASLKNVVLPNAKSIGNNAFYQCTALKSAEIQSASTIGTYAFNYCTALANVNCPSATKINNYGFNYCSKLGNVVFPSVTDVGTGAFSSCTGIVKADFPVATKLGRSCFQYCSAMKSLILRADSVASISSGSLNGTPIASGTGYIYVPSALIDSYKTASNWSTYAAQFRALEDYTVDGTITGELDESKI